MLAAGPVGLNLAGSFQYVDLMKESGDWGAAFTQPLTLNAQGWPTSDATITVFDERVNQPWNGPDPHAVTPDIGGTYHLSFQGQGAITTWVGNFTVQNQTYSATTNTTNADLVVPHNAYPFFNLTFTNTVDPANPTGKGVSNVQLLRPGYPAGTTQLFTNDYLNALKPFGTLRYLNVDAANDYGASLGTNGLLAPLNWSQRTPPDARTYNSPSNPAPSEPWENIIALANTTSTDLWINIPGPATDDYVTQLASLIKNGDTVNGVHYAGLNANLKVYVEYSNEVWGGSYNPYAYNNEAAREEVAAGGSKLNADGDNVPTDWAARRYLERSGQVAAIFHNVFGPDPTDARVRPVLGWQEQGFGYYLYYLPWFEANFGAPDSYFYGMGNANYWGPSDYSSVDAIINSLAANEAQTYATTVEFTAVADFYGLKNVAYEGGPSIGNDGTQASGQNALAASRDPRIEALVKQHYLDWYAAGGDVANYFDGPYDTWSPQNEWSAAELAQASSPSSSAKYRGIADIATAAPPAITAGLPVTSTTNLSIASDSVGQSFALPNTGQTNIWLLNAATAGTYNITLTTWPNNTGPAQPASIQILAGDQAVIGTYSVTQSSTFNLGSIALHAGLNTLGIRTLRGNLDPSSSNKYAFGFEPSSLTLTAAPPPGPAPMPAIGDAGFEAIGVSGNVAYDVPGSPWSFSGTSGIAANGSSFTAGNPAAPQGSQVGFVEQTGSVSQAVSGWLAGSYKIQLSAAERSSNGGRIEDFQVLVDNAVVATIAPQGTSYQTFTTGAFTVAAGTHSITIQGLDTAGGDNTALIDALSVTNTTAPMVTYFGTDSATQGSWSASYGSAGYNVIGGVSSLPSYATITPAGQQTYTWANSGTDSRDLQAGPGTASRVAAAWYGFSFTVDVSLTDGQAHQLSVYLLDWERAGRSERVDVIDPTSGTVLDSRTASSFGGGEYLTWTVTGHVQLRFTALAGTNAVLSGLFLGSSASSASAGFAGTDATTQGAWSPSYGSAGYEVLGGAISLPSYATITPAGQQTYTWAALSTDPRDLQVGPSSPPRVAATWYGSSFTVDVSLADGQAHKLSIYLLDWERAGRSERVDVIDPTSGTLLDSETASSFGGGEYLTWTVTGHVQLRFTDLAGTNAVLSGLFLNPASSTNSTNSAGFAGTDATTQGAWSSSYGSAGYNVIGGASSLPSYATITPAGQQTYTWAALSTDPRDLQVGPNLPLRVAAAWYGSSFTVDVSLTDGQSHQLSIYLLDWESAGRSERIDLIDPTSGTVLDSRTASSFGGGEYLTWTVTGHVQLRFTSLSWPNAVVSGFFLGSAVSNRSVGFAGTDATTQGAWSPSYGSAGYEVLGGAISLPSYAAVTPAGQQTYTWASSGTDPRDLQVGPNSPPRVAAAWYGSSFTVDVSLTDGQSHQLSIYLLDWENAGRSERIDLIDPTSGKVLDTQTASSFSSGEYLTWTVTGHVQLRFTALTEPNAVVSGFFLS